MSVFEIKRSGFYLDGKPFQVISGSIHYFRVVPEYWRDRLLKLRAMGCNTVETYHPATHPIHLPSGFDDSLYPFEEHQVPHHAAIVAANQYMIDHCSHLIMYAKHIGSNTRNYLDYARTREDKGLLHIVNLANII